MGTEQVIFTSTIADEAVLAFYAQKDALMEYVNNHSLEHNDRREVIAHFMTESAQWDAVYDLDEKRFTMLNLTEPETLSGGIHVNLRFTVFLDDDIG